MIRGRTRHLLRADAQCGNIIGEQPPPRAIRGRSGFALAELGRPDQRRGRGHGEDGISATANSNRRVTNACWIYAFGAELISNKRPSTVQQLGGRREGWQGLTCRPRTLRSRRLQPARARGYAITRAVSCGIGENSDISNRQEVEEGQEYSWMLYRRVVTRDFAAPRSIGGTDPCTGSRPRSCRNAEWLGQA